MSQKQSHFLPSLDGIRALSILLVVGAHTQRVEGFPDAWRKAFSHIFSGHLGVQVFFVLSGFLISYLLFKERDKNGSISLGKFYMRRILRIFPVYYAYIFVLFLMDRFGDVDITNMEYATSILYVKNFFVTQWVNGHLWSLCVEEQFYLLWPMALAFLSSRARVAFVLVLILAAPPARVLLYWLGYHELMTYSFFTNMDALMIGCLTAYLSHRYKDEVIRVLNVYPYVGRVLAVVIIYCVHIAGVDRLIPYLPDFIGPTIQSACAAYLILSYVNVQRGLDFKFLNLRPVTMLGVLSYSIYIWQQPFMARTGEITQAKPFFLMFPWNLLAVLVVACTSYYAFERPLMSLRKSFRT